MTILVTGSSGHLGEALVRHFKNAGDEVIGLDLLPSPCTDIVGSIANPSLVAEAVQGVDMVIHTAALHKPHVVTHSRQDFIDTNISGCLNLLEAAVSGAVQAFIYTSTTSVFGRALVPQAGAPAAWIDEDVVPVPKNIYGVTKKSAEDICELFHYRSGLPCLVLRTSRFFLDEDDNSEVRGSYGDLNIKVNEFLYRRVDMADVVSAHVKALQKAPSLGFGRYIISATTPFRQTDLAELRGNAPAVLKRMFPSFESEYVRRNWQMFPGIDRVYVNARACHDLAWEPQWNFPGILERLAADVDPVSPLARSVGFKGYHADRPDWELYPTE